MFFCLETVCKYHVLAGHDANQRECEMVVASEWGVADVAAEAWQMRPPRCSAFVTAQ